MWRGRAPMRRAAQPTDVANVVASLIADPYLTGEVIVVDGGMNLI
ncbi:SDR family oxidoreductase [Streptomyces sp. IBSNAI002]